MLDRKLVYRKSRLLKLAWLNLIEHRTLSMAAALHVTTALEAKEARQFHFSLPPFIEVPNGTDTGVVYEDSNISDHIRTAVVKGRYVLFLGRINWKKGLDRIIPAIARSPDIRFLIAGNDEEKYLRTVDALVNKHELRSRVDYVGYVSGADKLYLLQSAVALVAPSYSENFGNVVIEAMARQCPVIVTPEVGLADVVKQSGSGLVTPGTPKHLADSIGRISGDLSLARSMGEAGAKTVSENFDWGTVGQLMASAYSTVLGRETETGQD
jgi:glycosyltransferase involved in cell wall biosynthesis